MPEKDSPRAGQSATPADSPITPIIMVDELRPYPTSRYLCFRGGACHLTVNGDTPEHIEALHKFARSIGMKRQWFQDHRLAPHYDLTASKRDAALAIGAMFVSARDQAVERIARREAASAVPAGPTELMVSDPAYHPRDTGNSHGSRHLVVARTGFVRGRLRRDVGDALCKPARKFWELACYRGGSTEPATCKKCLEIAARHRLILPVSEGQS